MSNKQSETKALRIFRIFILTALAVLMFYPPYARGLYYFTNNPKELLAFHVLSFSLFIIFLIYKHMSKDYAIFKAPIDYAAAGLVVAYFLPVMFSQAASLRVAIGVLLQYCNYFIMYLMVRDMVKNRKELIILLNVMLTSAVGIALVGIDAAAGEKVSRIIEKVVNNLPGVDYKIFGGYVQGRMSSMLQYANTLASYLLAAFILSTGLTVYAKHKFAKHIYSGVSFILLLTFIFTYSRGAWLLFPIVYILFIILLWDVYHTLEAILYSSAVGIITLGCVPLLHKYLSAENVRGIWAVVLVGAIGAMVLSWVMGLLAAILKRFSRKQLLIAGATFILLVVICTGSLIGVALNIERAVELSNMDSDKNRTLSVSKVIDGVQSDGEYTLTYDVEYDAQDDKQWAYKVVVDSLKSSAKGTNEVENILEVTNLDMEEQGHLTFKTLQDTEKINVKVVAYYPKTYVKLQNVKLINEDMKVEKKIIFLYKYIPDSIVKRFNSINMQDNSVNARLAFYKDSFKIIKDYPIIGAGGGGWAALYFMYQSYMYWSTQTHNYFMQVWIEAGTLGLLVLMSFIGLLLWRIYTFYRRGQYKEQDKRSVLVAMLGAAVLSLLAHSAMDFDLSLSAVALMLWELIALLMVVTAVAPSESAQMVSKRWRYELLGMEAIGLITFVLVINLTMGYHYAQTAVKEMKKGEYKDAVAYFEKAVRHDPFTASYQMDLASLYESMAVQNKDGKKQVVNRPLFNKAEKIMQKALQLEPYNAQLYAHAASFAMNRGQIDQGLQYIDKSIEVQPLRVQNYQQKADVYLQLGLMNLNEQKYEQAEKALKEVLNIPVVMKELNQKILKPISLTDQTMEYIEKSDWLLKHYKDSDSVEKFSKLAFHAYMEADTNDDGVPDRWLLWNPKDGAMSSTLTESGTVKLTNAGKVRGLLATRTVSLKSETKYVLNIQAKGELDTKGNLVIYVLSDKGKHVQLQVVDVQLYSTATVLQYEFTTTDDITDGKQYIRFDYIGSDGGYAEIINVELVEK